MKTYLNPVHRRPCPDPFVLKHLGDYWCYCTGFWHDGRCIGILHSRDLIHWEDRAGALAPLEGKFPEYWAPEVVYLNGRFFLYYSVGDGTLMHLRVAVAPDPAGPFEDAGVRLTQQDFAIDAHVFQDSDGRMYMFYATDFLEHTHIGTGTVVDRLIDPYTLAGNARPVALARYDWQVYDPHRVEKGGVRWHTVEGPFVLERKGRYYEMFSGGNWQNATYGVSYATSADLHTQAEWTQIEHDERVPLVLRTLPGEVIGPGHNSVVRGPDNQQLFCVYHRWSAEAGGRVPAIDRMEWIGDRLAVLGPSTVPQPAPNPPTYAGFGEGREPGWRWNRGNWDVSADTAVLLSRELQAEANLPVSVPAFIMEVHVNDRGGEASKGGGFGIALTRGPKRVLEFIFTPSMRSGAISWMETGQSNGYYKLELPDRFDFEAAHLVRIEVDGSRIRIALDGIQRWHGRTGSAPEGISLFADNRSAQFRAFELTLGWRDLFLDTGADPADLGWHSRRGRARAPDEWSVAQNRLWGDIQGSSMLAKQYAFESYEAVFNARLADSDSVEGCYGFCPALRANGKGLIVTVEPGPDLYRIVCRDEAGIAATFELPDRFDASQFQQFRFRKHQGRMTLQHESRVLGELEVAPEPGRVGVFVHRAKAAFDEVRVTALPTKHPNLIGRFEK